MDQILQFVLNNGGSKGSEGPKCVKFSFVLNNGGSKGSERPKWLNFSNSC